jgi:hypothetical protein
MPSLRKPVVRGAIVCLLALLSAAPAEPAWAQVGAPPTAPTTLWNFLGIPYGIRKLQGATRNRRGNHPNREPKPPLKAIADPRNLESKDPSIKKAAEIKQAEDLKMQKIKAVKYLASIGCGCYDVDGGVTAALVASMGDCTEDVRYETIKAITDAAKEGCCAKCGSTCCCNKDILTAFAKIAYERDDHGCYVEPSQRVREAAAEGLRTCCPNSSPPVIVEPEKPKVPRETAEEIDEGETRESAPEGTTEPTPPTPPQDPAAEPLPAAGASTSAPASPARPFGFGVVVDVSPDHSLAHVHFDDPNAPAVVGAEIGVYQQVGAERRLVAVLHVVEAFPGSANVTGAPEALAAVARGDMVVRRLGERPTLHEATAAASPSALQAIAAASEPIPSAGEPLLPIESLPPVTEDMTMLPVAAADSPATAGAPAPAPTNASTAVPAAQPTPNEPAAPAQVLQASELRPLVAPQPRRTVRPATARRPITAVFMP